MPLILAIRPRFRLIGVSLVLVVLCVSIYGLVDRKPPLNWGQKTLRYVLSVRNTSNTLIENSELLVFSPLRETSHQKLLSLSVSEPHEESSDAYGNRILTLRLNLAPYAARDIAIQADLEFTDGSHFIELHDKDRYLVSEKYVERDAPEIETILREIDPDLTTITPERIYNWLKDNIRDAGYVREDRGALYAAKAREGDCTEFGYLFVALARRTRIPARLVGGFILPTSGAIKANSYHNWAEFYADGAWNIVDPLHGNFRNHQSDYVAFRVIGTDEKSPLSGSERFLSFTPELEVRLH